MRRDLAEYVLTEETRIEACLHRAAWHFTQYDTPLSLDTCEARGVIARPPLQLNGVETPAEVAKVVPRPLRVIPDDDAMG